MENLHTIINIIDNYKEKMMDNDYLEIMNCMGKLGEIISSIQESDDNSDNGSDYSSDYESDYESDDESIYSMENESDIEENMIDIDLLLDTINNNEIIFNKFMTDNNLSDDFKLSRFNVINQSAYNYVTNKTCKCKNNNMLCSYNNDNIYNCKNYQSFILKCPLLHLFVKKECNCCIEKITEEINKFKLFQFDGIIKNINIDENILDFLSSFMIIISNTNERSYKMLLFIGMINYVFNNSNIFIKNIIFTESTVNKLNLINETTELLDNVIIWANKFNFNQNIISIMINSLQSI